MTEFISSVSTILMRVLNCLKQLFNRFAAYARNRERPIWPSLNIIIGPTGITTVPGRSWLLAQRTLPNESRIPLLAGYIDRRQGRWEKSLEEMKQALELDPRNFSILQQILLLTKLCAATKRWPRLLIACWRLLQKMFRARVRRALVDLECRADPKPLHATIDAILAEDPNAAPVVVYPWLVLALRERDPSAVERALSIMADGGCFDENIPFPNGWCEGLAARLRGDDPAARAAFNSARNELEQTVRNQPDYASCTLRAWCG